MFPPPIKAFMGDKTAQPIECIMDPLSCQVCWTCHMCFLASYNRWFKKRTVDDLSLTSWEERWISEGVHNWASSLQGREEGLIKYRSGRISELKVG
jgi:hypothetical protein